MSISRTSGWFVIVTVAGRQGGDGLGADHHPGVLDDLEHLRNAVVDVTDEVADRRVLLAEGELAGGRDLQAHLLLDVRDVRAVALAELTGLEVDQELRHEEQRQALGAGAAGTGNALGAGEHQVEDVLRPVPLGRGDEALDALDVPGAVGLLEGLRPPGADVGAGVRLGEHHGGAPLALDRQLGEPLLVGGAVAVQDLREGGAGAEHVDRRVRAEDHLGDRPDQ
jgi:hypothetical protein